VYEGEAFVILPETSEYKILNGVGSRVWELVDGVRTQEEIARVISAEYDVALETALADVKEFLEELRANNMLANGFETR
jgi:uncharacterized lipoprotein YajG